MVFPSLEKLWQFLGKQKNSRLVIFETCGYSEFGTWDCKNKQGHLLYSEKPICGFYKSDS